MFLKKEMKHGTETVNKDMTEENLTNCPAYADLSDFPKNLFR